MCHSQEKLLLEKIKAYKKIIESRPATPYVIFLDDRKQLDEFRVGHDDDKNNIIEGDFEETKKDDDS